MQQLASGAKQQFASGMMQQLASGAKQLAGARPTAWLGLPCCCIRSEVPTTLMKPASETARNPLGWRPMCRCDATAACPSPSGRRPSSPRRAPSAPGGHQGDQPRPSGRPSWAPIRCGTGSAWFAPPTSRKGDVASELAADPTAASPAKRSAPGTRRADGQRPRIVRDRSQGWQRRARRRPAPAANAAPTSRQLRPGQRVRRRPARTPQAAGSLPRCPDGRQIRRPTAIPRWATAPVPLQPVPGCGRQASAGVKPGRAVHEAGGAG